MANAALEQSQASEFRKGVTLEGVRGSWGGLDGVDESDDPYANLRYAFKADRALAGGMASDETAGRSGRTAPPEPGGLSSTMQLALRVLPTRNTQEGHHPTSTRKQFGGPWAPKELAAKRPAPQSSKNETLMLRDTIPVERPYQESTRTESPTLHPASPALPKLASPPPRHRAGQMSNSRTDPTPTSTQARAFARGPFGPEERPKPREYAPGLAMRKRKVNLYDPAGLTASRQPFSMARSKPGPDVRGSWTTFDPEKNTLSFDKRWHSQQNKENSASSGGYDTGSAAEVPGSRPDESIDEKLDTRFENPDLDVDEDIRKEFHPVTDLMTEQPAPGSLQDHRNPFLLRSATSAPVMVVVGGRVAKVLKSGGDRRGESQDRFGNYVGKDLGRMKKHLIEDRQMKIRVRDEEMVEATRQKRALEALDPGQRELVLEKGQAPLGSVSGGLEVASEMFEFSDIPEVYLKSIAESILGRSARTTPLRKQDPKESSRQTSVALPGERLDTPVGHRELSDRLTPTSGASGSTGWATGANNAAIAGTRKSRGRKIRTTSPTNPNTPSLVNKDPELAPIEDIEDIPGECVVEDDDTKADVWSNLYILTSNRGRVVSVVLHDPVQFTPGAVMDRVFGGIIQEVQFHSRERIALIAFLFPAEAEDFVNHVKAAKRNNDQDYRRLQIDADWYRGSEHFAIYPFRYQTTLRVIGENAGRVLGINGVSPHKKKEDVSKELNIHLGKSVVRVGLITPKKRYVLERDGRMAIVEFASIKDAIEARRLFEGGVIHGYQRCSVQWLKDPCDKPAVKQPWCNCRSCAPVK